MLVKYSVVTVFCTIENDWVVDTVPEASAPTFECPNHPGEVSKRTILSEYEEESA